MAKRVMRMKELESYLEDVEDFENPKNMLEQYRTLPRQAAGMLLGAESQYEDIIGRSVADLGCGTGMLTIGAAVLGAEYVLGIELDEEALELCQRTVEEMEIPHVDLISLNVAHLHKMLKKCVSLNDSCMEDDVPDRSGLYKKFDTVIMNPPFGTKEESNGIDMLFLETAVAMAKTAVYSFHKSSTRKYITEKKAKEINVTAEVIESFEFIVPRTYKFHKKKMDTVKVDFIRFQTDSKL